MPLKTGILTTKLYRPRVSDDLVLRPRLLDRLHQGLERKLTLVSAPAGFGKTTLVASWLESCHRPSAWLSLDENDNDLILFLSYLIAAIRTLYPQACGDALGLVQSPQPPPSDSMTTSLINGISSLSSRSISGRAAPVIGKRRDLGYVKRTVSRTVLFHAVRSPRLRQMSYLIEKIAAY